MNWTQENRAHKTCKSHKNPKENHPLIHGQREIVCSPEEKAEVFADSLELLSFEKDIPSQDKMALPTKLMLYADDTGIMASSKSPDTVSTNLQTAMDALEKWFIK